MLVLHLNSNTSPTTHMFRPHHGIEGCGALRSLLMRLPARTRRVQSIQHSSTFFSTKSFEDLLHDGDENDLRRYRLERKEKQDKRRYAKMLRRKGLLTDEEEEDIGLSQEEEDARIEKSRQLKAEEHNMLFHEPVLIEEVLHTFTTPKVLAFIIANLRW